MRLRPWNASRYPRNTVYERLAHIQRHAILLGMAREATLSVSLTNQLRSYVDRKVQSGQYESASEVIRQSLRTLQEQEEQQRLYWADLRKKVKAARSAIAAGDVLDGAGFMRAKIAALRSSPKRAKSKRS